MKTSTMLLLASAAILSGCNNTDSDNQTQSKPRTVGSLSFNDYELQRCVAFKLDEDTLIEDVTRLLCKDTFGIKTIDDLGQLFALEEFDCESCIIETAIVPCESMPNLKKLYLDYNKLETLDTHSCSNLENVRTMETNQTTIDLSANLKLKSVHFSAAPYISPDHVIENITLPEGAPIESLTIEGGDFHTQAFNDLDNIRHLSFENNNTAQLNVGNLHNLTSLYASDNNIVNLNLANNSLLDYLELDNNDIVDIDLSANLNLKRVRLTNNPLSATTKTMLDNLADNGVDVTY